MANIPSRADSQNDSLMFRAYGAEGPSAELASECLAEAGAVRFASARSRFADLEPGVSVREGMNRENWEFFRPGEHVPRRKNQMIRVADDVYRFNPIVKFAIDMMADFVTQGIQIYHPAASKEKRYRHWWRKVGGQNVSERFVNLLYRNGCSIVKRNFGTLNQGDLRDLESGVAAVGTPSDIEMVERDIRFDRSPKPGRNRIPLKYTFMNPVTVEAVGGELSVFAGEQDYALRIPDTLLKMIRNAKTVEEKTLIANMPSYMTDMIGLGKNLVPLDKDKVSVHFYKKDDWQIWADPLVLSVLKDIILYEKMKDSDRAALDGAIRSVRLWRLGLPEHKIQPGPGAFRKLRDQLLANTGGGSMDLVWDAALDFKETSTDVYRYLGSSKYEPVLQSIYAGLGIPQSLTGGGSSGGMTNNALSLKTLIERLQYARNVLVEFWEREFHLIQRAFGDRHPARLRFDMMTLSDEASEKMLWVQLFDRNVVTMQTMREKFGLLDEVEVQRLKREYKAMDGGDAPHKLGPFVEAEPHPDQLSKAAMQQGTLAPTEAGVVKKPKARGDKSLLDRQAEQQDAQLDVQREQMAHDQKLAEKQQQIDEKQGGDLHRQKLRQNEEVHQQGLVHKEAEHKVTLPIKKQALKKKLTQKGQPQQGRPRNSKDGSKRKQRTPKVTASLFALQARGRGFLRAVSESETAAFLAEVGKGNLRQLSTAQARDLEARKFAALMRLDPDGGVLDVEPPVAEASRILDDLLHEAFGQFNAKPTADELRDMYVSAFALYHFEGESSEPADAPGVDDLITPEA